MTERSVPAAACAPKRPAPSLTLAAQAQRFGHWVGARVRIGQVAQVGAVPFAPHSGRVGTVTETHFAGVYVRLDPTPRERTVKIVLVLLQSRSPPGGVDEGMLTPLSASVGAVSPGRPAGHSTCNCIQR